MQRLVAVLLLFPLVVAPAEADDTGPNVTVPAGIPVRMDGWLNPSEWSDSTALDMGAGSTLRLKQVRGTLLIGLDLGVVWPKRGHLLLHLAPGKAAQGVATVGALRIDFEPREHDRQHVLVTRMETPVPKRVPHRVVARFGESRTFTHVELAVPGDLLPSGPARLVAQVVAPGKSDFRLWPTALALGKAPRGIPPALRTGVAWGRLTSLQTDGPGAFPASQWKAWLDADKELERRGDEMHSYRYLIDEEWKNQPKDDALAEKEFFANLRWIAMREPLTPTDLLAKAQILHWSNRREEALGIYETLAHTDPDLARRSAGSRAELFESMHRFREAEAIWRGIADRKGLPSGTAALYGARADRARRYQTAWDQEQALRRAAEQAGGPLVALTTKHGTCLLLLDAKDQPKAVEHFLSFVEDQSYAGTLFHRVIGDNLAAGGDLATKEHGCDVSAADRGKVVPRSIPESPRSQRAFFRGTLALFWHPDRKFKSDFFIVTGAHPDWRTERHLIIGHVISGRETIDRISRCDAIESIRILRR